MTTQLTLMSISDFRDDWLEDFFLYGRPHGKIPPEIASALMRKRDIINAATSYRDLRSPPGNKLEALNSPLSGCYSIRVNRQYRLIFIWSGGKAKGIYLDPHTYNAYR